MNVVDRQDDGLYIVSCTLPADVPLRLHWCQGAVEGLDSVQV